MIKRELKVNFKNFIIWLLILIGIFLLVYLIYPYIITDESMKSMDELMKVFPEDVLKTFNMDITSVSTAYGWFKSEGFMFILIIIGLYASFLGGSILLKEENDKTIEYLATLPIKRKSIVTNKLIVCILYITFIIVILGIFNYISLKISGNLDTKQFVLLSITPTFIAYPLFAINLFISTFLQKTKKTIGISLGMVFIFYIISILSELSSKVEILKYFSIYTLADTRNVILNVKINPTYILISFIITIIFVIGTYYRYEKKELI